MTSLPSSKVKEGSSSNSTILIVSGSISSGGLSSTTIVKEADTLLAILDVTVTVAVPTLVGVIMTRVSSSVIGVIVTASVSLRVQVNPGS